MPKVFEVERAEIEWVLKARGQVVASYKNRGSAVAEGTRLAAANEPSRLVIKRASGSIELERTFGYVELQ